MSFELEKFSNDKAASSSKVAKYPIKKSQFYIKEIQISPTLGNDEENLNLLGDENLDENEKLSEKRKANDRDFFQDEIEYCWRIMNAKKKINLPDKHSNDIECVSLD